MKDAGQYMCLIQNEKVSNYRKAFLQVIDNEKGKKSDDEQSYFMLPSGIFSAINSNTMFIYAIILPLGILGSMLLLIFCFRYRHQKQQQQRQRRGTDSLKSSFRPRQPLIHYNGAMVPSTTSVVSNDPLTNSVDSIPVARQYQQPRYGPASPSDLASLTSSNLYYTRVQAL